MQSNQRARPHSGIPPPLARSPSHQEKLAASEAANNSGPASRPSSSSSSSSSKPMSPAMSVAIRSNTRPPFVDPSAMPDTSQQKPSGRAHNHPSQPARVVRRVNSLSKIAPRPQPSSRPYPGVAAPHAIGANTRPKPPDRGGPQVRRASSLVANTRRGHQHPMSTKPPVHRQPDSLALQLSQMEDLVGEPTSRSPSLEIRRGTVSRPNPVDHVTPQSSGPVESSQLPGPRPAPPSRVHSDLSSSVSTSDFPYNTLEAETTADHFHTSPPKRSPDRSSVQRVSLSSPVPTQIPPAIAAALGLVMMNGNHESSSRTFTDALGTGTHVGQEDVEVPTTSSAQQEKGDSILALLSHPSPLHDFPDTPPRVGPINEAGGDTLYGDTAVTPTTTTAALKEDKEDKFPVVMVSTPSQPPAAPPETLNKTRKLSEQIVQVRTAPKPATITMTRTYSASSCSATEDFRTSPGNLPRSASSSEAAAGLSSGGSDSESGPALGSLTPTSERRRMKRNHSDSVRAKGELERSDNPSLAFPTVRSDRSASEGRSRIPFPTSSSSPPANTLEDHSTRRASDPPFLSSVTEGEDVSRKPFPPKSPAWTHLAPLSSPQRERKKSFEWSPSLSPDVEVHSLPDSSVSSAAGHSAPVSPIATSPLLPSASGAMSSLEEDIFTYCLDDPKLDASPSRKSGPNGSIAEVLQTARFELRQLYEQSRDKIGGLEKMVATLKEQNQELAKELQMAKQEKSQDMQSTSYEELEVAQQLTAHSEHITLLQKENQLLQKQAVKLADALRKSKIKAKQPGTITLTRRELEVRIMSVIQEAVQDGVLIPGRPIADKFVQTPPPRVPAFHASPNSTPTDLAIQTPFTYDPVPPSHSGGPPNNIGGNELPIPRLVRVPAIATDATVRGGMKDQVTQSSSGGK